MRIILIILLINVSAGTLFATNAYGVPAEKENVTGVVSDENGNPIAGVVVSILGTTTGDVTRTDGKYSIGVAVGETLQYSFIGYKTQEIKVGTESVINVKLEIEGIKGDEVVVVGFGTIKKSSLTGSVAVIKADQLADRPVQNVAQALQGMVPGLNLTANKAGGDLNNTLDINIRGVGTIGDGSNSAPLVLIDGMEGNLNTLNPQDIESISVMKDASSATIYGSRAPFGVILITTKKGSQGKAKVNYNNSFRWSAPVKLPNMSDSEVWAEYFNEGSVNAGNADTFDPYVMDNIRKYKNGEIEYGTEAMEGQNRWRWYHESWANNDWFDIIYKDWSFSQEHNASVSGGSEKMQYYISANYLDQGGLLNFSEDTYDRYAFSTKINAELTSWASISATTRFTKTDYDASNYQNMSNQQFHHNIYRRFPTNPMIFPTHPDKPMSRINYSEQSEINQLKYGGRNEVKNKVLSQQVNITLEPIENWTIVGEMNYRVDNYFAQNEVLPIYIQTPNGTITPVAVIGGFGPGASRVSVESYERNFVNPNIYTNYEKLWNSGHSFKATIGFQSESEFYSKINSQGDELISSDLPTVNNTTVMPVAGSNYEHWATAGFFGRFNYSYKDKYLLEVSARYDGTSRFMEDQRWNLFPSVSVGWNMKHESFLKDVAKVDMIKLRGSWGQLGNQNTKLLHPFYQTMPVWKDYSWLINGVKPGIYANGPELVSTLLTWETIQDWNIGVDFGFLNNRLVGSFEVFNRKTLDMVGPAPTLPGVLGVKVPKMNNADLESKGWEFDISWRDRIQSIGLSYGVRVNISDARQTVTRYPNEKKTIDDNTWYNGKELGTIFGYTTVGIAQTDEEMNAHLANVDQSSIAGGTRWGAGDIMYADLNNDGIINGGAGTLDDSGDWTVIGNSTPRYNYGITADVAWKGFDFSIFIQGVGKRDYAPSGFVFWGQTTDMWQSTALNEHMDYWRPTDDTGFFGPNTDGYYPKPYLSGENRKNQQTQTRYLQDASYMRIKNIQFGYTLPTRISNKLSLQNVRIFFSADNVATFTKLSDVFDPETISAEYGDGRTYPLSKVISFGINVTL